MHLLPFHVLSRGTMICISKDVLGMYVGRNESAKLWLSILNGLKNRGVEDILVACVDGATLSCAVSWYNDMYYLYSESNRSVILTSSAIAIISWRDFRFGLRFLC